MNLLPAIAVPPGLQEVEILVGLPPFRARRGGEDEAAGPIVLPEIHVADQEVPQGLLDGRVGESEATGVVLDLLEDRSAFQDVAVEVFVPLADQDLVGLEIQPAPDTQAGLVQVAADRGVRGPLGGFAHGFREC